MRVLLFLLLSAVAGIAHAAPRVDIACLPGSSRMTLVEARAAAEGDWQAGQPELPFFDGLNREWCRLSAQAPGDDGLIVEFDGRAVISISVPTVYAPGADTGHRLRDGNGGQGSFSHRIVPTLRVSEAMEGQPYYLRFEGRRPPDTVITRASGLEDFVYAQRRAHEFDVGIIVAMAMLGMMASIFAFQLGRLVLIYLGVWVLAVLVQRGIESGILLDWFPMSERARITLQALSVGIAVASSTVFSSFYLDFRTHFPRAVWLLRLLAAAVLCLCPIQIFYYSEPLRLSLNLVVLAQFLMVISMAAWRAWRRDASARYFMLGWAPVLVMSIVRTIGLVTGQPIPGWAENLWQLTLVGAVFTLLAATSRAARYAEREMRIARAQASTDPLTGLPNRSALQRSLSKEVTAARDTALPLSVLFMDLDHFKQINDRHGHDVGDRCLRHFADAIRARLRASDVLARLGGEEFVVLLPGLTLPQARHVADDLRAVLAAAPIMLAGEACHMTMSIGVARLRPDDNAESLLKRADDAVYQAKREGRDRAVLEREVEAV